MERAAERHNREMLEQATAASVGAVTGMTGDTKPMRTLERALLGSASSAQSAMGGDIQQRLHAFARRAGARGGGHGAHGR